MARRRLPAEADARIELKLDAARRRLARHYFTLARTTTRILAHIKRTSRTIARLEAARRIPAEERRARSLKAVATRRRPLRAIRLRDETGL
jgi:hypothetical protein